MLPEHGLGPHPEEGRSPISHQHASSTPTLLQSSWSPDLEGLRAAAPPQDVRPRPPGLQARHRQVGFPEPPCLSKVCCFLFFFLFFRFFFLFFRFFFLLCYLSVLILGPFFKHIFHQGSFHAPPHRLCRGRRLPGDSHNKPRAYCSITHNKLFLVPSFYPRLHMALEEEVPQLQEPPPPLTSSTDTAQPRSHRPLIHLTSSQL